MVRDEGDGLYLMRHRHYEAQLGRFVQPDPIGIAWGTNLYAYTFQNPTTFIDPSGLVGLLGLALGGLAVVGIVAAGYALQAGAKAFDSYMAKKKVSDNAVVAMTDQSPQCKVAENIVDKMNPTGMHTGPVTEVLGMGKTIGTTAAENLVPGAREGAGAVRTVVYEGVKTATFEGINQTMDNVANPVGVKNASGAQNLKPVSPPKPGCKKK